MTNCILTVNSGSSTIKFGMFEPGSAEPSCLGKAVLQKQTGPSALSIALTTGGKLTVPIVSAAEDLDSLITEVLGAMHNAVGGGGLFAVGHRVVHGGEDFAGPAAITPEVLDRIKSLVPLAPLHQPQSIRLIEAIRRVQPSLPQTASFDTAFHRTLILPARRFAIPRELHDSDIRRYGFHGLSYSHIAKVLPSIAPGLANGRVVIAHLGSGASLCALQAGVSKDTTMGFSTLDGVPMSTRCGALDPGVIFYLLEERRMSASEVEALLYQRSGLLGMSGISGDTRTLHASAMPEAKEALEAFAFHIARSVAALATSLQGLDGIIFTGGVGEHQPQTRSAICDRLGWLGVKLDSAANRENAASLSASDSSVAVLVIPANEEQQIASDVVRLLAGSARTSRDARTHPSLRSERPTNEPD